MRRSACVMCVTFDTAPLPPFGAGLGRQDSLPRPLGDSSVAHRERELSLPVDDERTFSMGQSSTRFTSQLELPRTVRDDGSDTSGGDGETPAEDAHARSLAGGRMMRQAQPTREALANVPAASCKLEGGPQQTHSNQQLRTAVLSRVAADRLVKLRGDVRTAASNGGRPMHRAPSFRAAPALPHRAPPEPSTSTGVRGVHQQHINRGHATAPLGSSSNEAPSTDGVDTTGARPHTEIPLAGVISAEPPA